MENFPQPGDFEKEVNSLEQDIKQAKDFNSLYEILEKNRL